MKHLGYAFMEKTHFKSRNFIYVFIIVLIVIKMVEIQPTTNNFTFEMNLMSAH